MRADEPQLHVTTHQPLLGTVVEVRVVAAAEPARSADAAVVAEMQRLEHVFSAFDETSELCRWRRGSLDAPGDELAALLEEALHWQVLGRGTFNPSAGALSRLWADGRERDAEPDPEALRAVVASIQGAAFTVDAGVVRRTGDCSALNLSAIAKGRIVDCAAIAARRLDGIESIVVNAGGDLVHHGSGGVSVGIENPATPFDNVPPLTIVDISNRAVATSGSARRGVHIGGRWFSHVIDPRDGRPVDRIRSATVIAPDACTADVVATIVGVLDASDGIAFVESLDDVSCLLVDDAATLWRSTRWRRFERDRQQP